MSMRIAIVGNCQVGGLQKCLTALMGNGSAEAFFVHGLESKFQTKENLFAALRDFDVVYYHGTDQPMFYGSAAELVQAVPRAREMPFVMFTGFHPEMVYVTLGNGGPIVRSPVGENHSALALFAFQEGLTTKQAKRLYSPESLRRVGLLNFWRDSHRQLVEQGKRLNCPLDRMFAQWSRRGCFMHTLNHPKIFVLADIARWMIASAGGAVRDVAAEDIILDDLLTSTIWPVYPGLATEFGIRGSSLFKKVGETVFLELDDFLEQSFAAYEPFGSGGLHCWLPNLWRFDRELSNWMLTYARA